MIAYNKMEENNATVVGLKYYGRALATELPIHL